MIPRRSVTSFARARPVSLRTALSFSLPFRYSITSTLMPISLHSWKPASGPSVLPVPRSTRKLNCAYGRSRRTAISGSLGSGLLQPNEVVEGDLELFVGDAAVEGIEGRARPAARPGADEPPRVRDAPAGTFELVDRDLPPVVGAVDDASSPVVELRGARQRTPEDDRLEAVDTLSRRRDEVRLGREPADFGEAELAVSDQDPEVAGSKQRFVELVGRHQQWTLLRYEAFVQRVEAISRRQGHTCFSTRRGGV